MKAISVKNLKKTYALYDSRKDKLKEAFSLTGKKYHKNFEALKGISFDVEKGECVGIIGLNGSGKSTLLKILTEVITQTEGTVEINGKVSALLELGAGFNPEYSGLENIYLNTMLMGYTRKETDDKLDQILEFADIGDFINQPVKIYSSGMFVRLAFAIAITIDPDILIIDEALSMGLLFSSCSDWLDVTPVDTRTTENFYTTPSQMEQALIGVYNGLLPLSTYALLMSEVRSDNTWCGELSTAQRDYMDISSFNPNISTIATVRDAWNDLFEIVSRANLFLSKVDGVNYTIEGIKEQQIGEARFLRALAYFDLVRYYGRVPLTLVPQTISEAMSTPQSEAVEIYEKVIIPDLEYAVGSLTEEPKDYLGRKSASGRATLTAAKALLGRVYLTMAGFPLYDETKKELARELLEEVIDYADATGKFWAKNASEWQRMWINENDNKYHIFEIQYIVAKDYGNPMVFHSVPRLPSKYVTLEMSGNSIACAKGLDNLLKEEQDEEGHFLDVRCLATIDTTKFVNDDNPNSVTKYAGEDFFIKFLEHKMKREALGYDDINAQIVDRTYFPLNFPLIRLEDVMLMYAEIVGPTSKGVDMVDRIRRRAGIPVLTNAEKEPAAFRECVDKERRRELACEGIRWHDLVRHNNLQAVRDKFQEYAVDANGNVIRPTLLLYIRQIKDGTYLYPIPDSQMKVKEGLYVQNEAYR